MHSRLAISVATVALLCVGCGSGDGGPTGPAPTISIALSSATLSITQGQNGTVTVTLSRSNGYEGLVSLALDGAPQGVAASFSQAAVPAGSSSSTLTLHVTATVTPGTYALSVRASGAGVSGQTADLTLVVSATPAFTLSISPQTLDAAVGGEASALVTVQRTNLPGTISLTASGAPPGVTVTATPPELTGTSATLAIQVSETAPTGTHTLTLTGRADGLADRTATVTLNIHASTPVSIVTPENVVPVIGQPFSLELQADGPGSLVFESAGDPLPDGLSLNAVTGEITGTPTASALLSGSPIGTWGGIVIRVSSGTSDALTDPFTITIVGTTLPAPYAYMSFDGSNLGDAFGRAGIAMGNVATGREGIIGDAVFVGGTNSHIRYPTSLSSQLNGRAAFTLATTISTTSAGTMFFNLSDRFTHYSRAYAKLDNGRIAVGGRSRNSDDEPFRAAIGTRPVNDGRFHTIVGVIDLPVDRVTIYVDGDLDVSTVLPFAATTFETFMPADQSIVGHLSTLADTSLAPDVTHDEMALWDVALDAAQAATVAWLARSGRSLQEWIGF